MVEVRAITVAKHWFLVVVTVKQSDRERLRRKTRSRNPMVECCSRCGGSAWRSVHVGCKAVRNPRGSGFKLDALPIVPRQLLDIIRMIAYRAETVMMPAVFQAQGKKRNARKLLNQLFQCEANLIPQPERGLLRVQFLDLASDCTDRAMLPLIEQLNAARTQFPGTELTLFYELSSAGSFENERPAIR